MTRLADIVARRRARVGPAGGGSEVSPSTRDFQQYAYTGREGLSVIAELGRREPFDPRPIGQVDLVDLARRLDEAEIDGAVLGTEREAWGGDLDDLRAVSAACPDLPLLRRDVVLEDEDVWASRVGGADAVVLIPAILDAGRLRRLSEACASTRMAAVATCWSGDHVTRAVAAGVRVLELQAFDLEDGTRDPSRILRLAEPVPPHVTLLGAGLEVEEMLPLAGRIDGVVIGRALAEADDPAALVRRLKEAGHG